MRISDFINSHFRHVFNYVRLPSQPKFQTPVANGSLGNAAQPRANKIEQPPLVTFLPRSFSICHT